MHFCDPANCQMSRKESLKHWNILQGPFGCNNISKPGVIHPAQIGHNHNQKSLISLGICFDSVKNGLKSCLTRLNRACCISDSTLCPPPVPDSFCPKKFFQVCGLIKKSPQEVKKVFSILDNDGSGFIEEEELKWVYSRCFWVFNMSVKGTPILHWFIQLVRAGLALIRQNQHFGMNPTAAILIHFL